MNNDISRKVTKKSPQIGGFRDRMNLTVNMVIQSFIIFKFLFYKYNDSFLKYKLLCFYAIKTAASHRIFLRLQSKLLLIPVLDNCIYHFQAFPVFLLVLQIYLIAFHCGSNQPEISSFEKKLVPFPVIKVGIRHKLGQR